MLELSCQTEQSKRRKTKKKETNFIAKQNLAYNFKMVDKLCHLYKFWFKNKIENKFLGYTSKHVVFLTYVGSQNF